MNVVRIGITDDTQPEDMDRYFSRLWKHRPPHVLVFDTTQCNNISLRRMLGMKKVLKVSKKGEKFQLLFFRMTEIFFQKDFLSFD